MDRAWLFSAHFPAVRTTGYGNGLHGEAWTGTHNELDLFQRHGISQPKVWSYPRSKLP
ncbi:hypothetical protein MPNT_50175 [Candidatus Methylacidithermus pantelleriae]|uniref:Uncharacterized protein n=1 Tax=Candidatus Methylacidithermus pantelleriae TaxID=2744239 RepID=A0A8J2BVR6_9BACT|nr:hypothetical protein MPNT_50175 [Candidatus Methylacidithermus pantelleriae]